jgi:hypothetical protein
MKINNNNIIKACDWLINFNYDIIYTSELKIIINKSFLFNNIELSNYKLNKIFKIIDEILNNEAENKAFYIKLKLYEYFKIK